MKAISDEQIEEFNDLGIFVEQVLLLSITCAFRRDFRLKNLASKICSLWRVYYGKQHKLEIILSVPQGPEEFRLNKLITYLKSHP